MADARGTRSKPFIMLWNSIGEDVFYGRGLRVVQGRGRLRTDLPGEPAMLLFVSGRSRRMGMCVVPRVVSWSLFAECAPNTGVAPASSVSEATTTR